MGLGEENVLFLRLMKAAKLLQASESRMALRYALSPDDFQEGMLITAQINDFLRMLKKEYYHMNKDLGAIPPDLTPCRPRLVDREREIVIAMRAFMVSIKKALDLFQDCMEKTYGEDFR
jgi:hypothetical protein